jgi:hypothetical protein
MKHRSVVRVLSAFALVSGVWVAVLTSAATAAAVPQYGIGFTKGCVSPTLVGAPYQCSYTIQNTFDTVGDTLTITNMSDVVHAAAGDVASPANYFALLHFDILAGSPVCTGGTGTGTIANPWIGVTSCSMPAGSKLETANITYYTVAAGDFATSPLQDEAILNWVNACNGTGGTSCSTLPQHTTTTSQSVINKNPSNTVTAIKQGGQTVTSVAAGSSVTDQATVSGSAGTPTGTVTFTFYTSGNCTTGGTVLTPNSTLSGAVATSAAQGPLGQGSYSFQATYNGNGAYNTSTGTCEPLTVGLNPSNTVTAIKQGGQTVTSVAAGTSVTDQATVSGSAGTPTGTVTFTFFNNANCSGDGAVMTPNSTLSGGIATSAAQGPLGQGSYSFQATYNGQAGLYATSTGACEPLTVGLNPSNTVTAIKQGGQTVTSVLAGSSVTDQATVSGSAGTPTGTVTFTFFTNANCSGEGAVMTPNSTLSGGVATSGAQGPLSVGSYSFQATYNGQAGLYGTSTGACEPLSVTPVTTTTTFPVTTTTFAPPTTTTTVPPIATTTIPVSPPTTTTTTTVPPISTTTFPVNPPTIPTSIPIGPPKTGAGGSAQASDSGVVLTASGLLLFAGLAGMALLLRRRRA